MIKKGEREGEGTTKSKTSQMQINDSDMGTAASTRLTDPQTTSAQGLNLTLVVRYQKKVCRCFAAAEQTDCGLNPSLMPQGIYHCPYIHIYINKIK